MVVSYNAGVSSTSVPIPLPPAPVVLTRDRQPSSLPYSPPSSRPPALSISLHSPPAVNHGVPGRDPPGQPRFHPTAASRSQSPLPSQLPWTSEEFADDFANPWDAELPATVWASSSHVLRRRRASTRASLSPSTFSLSSTSPLERRDSRASLGVTAAVCAFGGSLLDPWARSSSPTASECSGGDDGGSSTVGYALGNTQAALDTGRSQAKARLGISQVDIRPHGCLETGPADVVVVERARELEMHGKLGSNGSLVPTRSGSPTMDANVQRSETPGRPSHAETAVLVEDGAEQQEGGHGVEETVLASTIQSRLAEQQAKGIAPLQRPLRNCADSSSETDVADGSWSESNVSTSRPVPEKRSGQPRPALARYPLDLGLMDALFPDTLVPVCSSSSTAISGHPRGHGGFDADRERATWSRVSRYGSSRQHRGRHGLASSKKTTSSTVVDIDDDDRTRWSHGRVTWEESTIRQEAVQTVRRWLEEASSGRQTSLRDGRFRGGGGSRSSNGLFDWNSAQPSPVSPNAFFKSPRWSQTLQSTVSTGSPGGPPRAQPRQSYFGDIAAPTLSSLSLPVSPITSPLPGTSATSPLPLQARFPVQTSRWSLPSPPRNHPDNLDVAGQHRRDLLSIKVSTTAAPKRHVIVSNGHGDVDDARAEDENAARHEPDDDEWGEMVSTPARGSRDESAVADRSFSDWENHNGSGPKE